MSFKPAVKSKEQTLPGSFKEHYVFGRGEQWIVVRIPKIKDDNERNGYANDFRIEVLSGVKDNFGRLMEISGEVGYAKNSYENPDRKIQFEHFATDIIPSANHERRKAVPAADRLIAINAARGLAHCVLKGETFNEERLNGVIQYFGSLPKDKSYAADPVFVEAMKQADDIQELMARSLIGKR